MEKINGWCCTDCNENFYLPVGSVDINEWTVRCPYCGEFENTVMNTIPKRKE